MVGPLFEAHPPSLDDSAESGSVKITRVPGDVLVVRAESVTGKIALVLTYDQANELWGEPGNQLQGHKTE